ncbi:hypothetical protein GCM10027425_21450 [Alteromonas gracilis]
MAKALLGHLGADPRQHSRMAHENASLRRRVSDLEALVAGLQAELDRRDAADRDRQHAADAMQPA